MPGIAVQNNDALEVFEAAGISVARARKGEGPTLIEVKTDRYLGHFQGDPEVYRPKGEVEQLRRNDPIVRLGGQLRQRQLLDDARDSAIRARVHRQVEQAYEFARNSKYPNPSEALEHVFV